MVCSFQELCSRLSAYFYNLMDRFLPKPVCEPLSALTVMAFTMSSSNSFSCLALNNFMTINFAAMEGAIGKVGYLSIHAANSGAPHLSMGSLV